MQREGHIMAEEKKEQGAKKFRTKRQKVAVAKKICEKYAEGKYTIESVCKSYGVPIRTFTQWAFDWESRGYDSPTPGFVAEIAELYKKSKEQFDIEQIADLRELALTGLQKKLKGYDFEEVHTELKEVLLESGEKALVPKGIKKVKKHIPPSDTAIIFVTKNLVSEKFSETYVQKHEGSVETKSELDGLSKEELEERIAKLRGVIKKADEYELE